MLSVLNLEPDNQIYKDIKKQFDTVNLNLVLISVEQVCNSVKQAEFEDQKTEFIKNNIPVDISNLYHSTRADLYIIIKEGLDVAKSSKGFLGNAIYLSECPLKANDYNKFRGIINVERIMIRCSVLAGKVKEYDIGCFDNTLNKAPEGFNSTRSFVSRNYEYGIYNNSQVIITEIIKYKVIDISIDKHNNLLPSALASKCVMITSFLRQLFNKLRMLCPENSIHDTFMRYYIGELLKKNIDTETFLINITKILGKPTFSSIKDKIDSELERCNLSKGKPSLPLPEPFPEPLFKLPIEEQNSLEKTDNESSNPKRVCIPDI